MEWTKLYNFSYEKPKEQCQKGVQQMKSKAYPVTFRGQKYKSLKAFAASLNLKYSNVVRYYQQGKDLEDIVVRCQYTTASKAQGEPKETAKRYPVEYEGVKYPSLYAAAESLNIPLAYLYDLRRRRGMSATEAIKHALEHPPRTISGQSPRAKPCVVEGITYPSQEAAIQAYHMSRITVYSRMEREGISFEEALVRGRNSAVYRPPTASLFPELQLVPAKGGEISLPILAELSRSLEYYRYQVQTMANLKTGIPALCVNGHSYIYFNHAARGLEIISELPIDVDRETLWELNAAYVAVKLFTSGKTIYLSAFQSAKEEGQEIKSLLNTWFSYLSIRDSLIRRFPPSQPEK